MRKDGRVPRLPQLPPRRFRKQLREVDAVARLVGRDHTLEALHTFKRKTQAGRDASRRLVARVRLPLAPSEAEAVGWSVEGECEEEANGIARHVCSLKGGEDGDLEALAG